MGILLVLLSGQVAHADSEQFRVRYHAYDGCPSSGEFIRQVLARTKMARLSNGAEPAHDFDVSIVRREDGGIGHLGIREPDGSSSARDVEAASCEEVVGALALIAALTLDPSASTKPLPSKPATTVPETSPEATPVAKPEPGAARVNISPVPVHVVAPAGADQPPRSTASRLTGWSSAQAIMTGGIGGVAPGFAMAIGLGRLGGWSTRLSVREAIPSTVDTGNGSARFQWMAGRLEGCPLTLEPVKWLWIEPCLDAEVGRLHGEGIGGTAVSQPMNDSALWLAGGATARVRADIAGGVGVELETGLVIPVIEHNFVFERDLREIYRVPVVAGSGALGLSIHFP